jgi:hypothetical protein
MEARMWNSKPKKSGHKCRKKKAGNPKVSRGVCYGGMERNYLEVRRESKLIVKRYKTALDPDDVE